MSWVTCEDTTSEADAMPRVMCKSVTCKADAMSRVTCKSVTCEANSLSRETCKSVACEADALSWVRLKIPWLTWNNIISDAEKCQMQRCEVARKHICQMLKRCPIWRQNDVTWQLGRCQIWSRHKWYACVCVRFNIHTEKCACICVCEDMHTEKCAWEITIQFEKEGKRPVVGKRGKIFPRPLWNWWSNEKYFLLLTYVWLVESVYQMNLIIRILNSSRNMQSRVPIGISDRMTFHNRVPFARVVRYNQYKSQE